MNNAVALVVAMFLMAGSAHAASIYEWIQGVWNRPSVDYGKWHCNGCEILKPGEDYNVQIFGQVGEYIRANNPEIHASRNEIVDKWPKNSRITICDGVNCMDFWFDPLPLARWAPRSTAKPQKSTDQPRVPKNPSPQTSLPSEERMIGLPGFVQPGNAWDHVTIIVPNLYPFTRPKTPSVTVIDYGDSTSYSGPALEIPFELNQQIGDYLDWGPESSGLNYGSSGGACYHGAFCDSSW